MRVAPAIHVRNGRINFKFGDQERLLPHRNRSRYFAAGSSGRWRVDLSAQPARTDRTAQGLGSFTLRGRWYAAPGRVDARHGSGSRRPRRSDRTDEVVKHRRHGTLTSRLHLAGPLNNMGITGRSRYRRRASTAPGAPASIDPQLLGPPGVRTSHRSSHLCCLELADNFEMDLFRRLAAYCSRHAPTPPLANFLTRFSVKSFEYSANRASSSPLRPK